MKIQEKLKKYLSHQNKKPRKKKKKTKQNKPTNLSSMLSIEVKIIAYINIKKPSKFRSDNLIEDIEIDKRY